jgi:hypothetical protein
MDMTIDDTNLKKGSKNVKDNPIGGSFEISGTKEEIKERICYKIDEMGFKLEDLYFGKD